MTNKTYNNHPWISVGERLPTAHSDRFDEISETVLINAQGNGVCRGFYHHGEQTWYASMPYHNYKFIGAVTHWMPLPTPPNHEP